uniref:t-SNARE coiled-coil homology domain-containing protein n=1 Tax=Romanomermis culicivorax TaxID=13658 RepID=A0A915L4C0_ROMCU
KCIFRLRIENLVTYTSKTIEHRLNKLSVLPYSTENHNDENIEIKRGSDEKPKVDIRRRKVPKNQMNRLQDKSDDKSLKIIRQTMHQKVDKQKLIAMEADVQQSKEEWARVCEELKPEEKIQLEAENKSLIEEFTSKNDELKKLTGQVVEIANLQSIFAEKVIQQDTDIFRIHDVTIHSTENIKMGNEAIRQAMKKKAFMRVFIIFTLIVLSFTLLFLDWYNQ